VFDDMLRHVTFVFDDMFRQVTFVFDDMFRQVPFELWFSVGPLASSTNTTHRHDITEILLRCTVKVLSEFDLIFGVLMPLSTIFQLYHGDQY
jgi:hypothetical protein